MYNSQDLCCVAILGIMPFLSMFRTPLIGTKTKKLRRLERRPQPLGTIFR